MKKLLLLLVLLIAASVAHGQGAGTAAKTYPSTFVNLGTPANGSVRYCTNCNANTSPCTGGGTGAFANRVNGAWSCETAAADSGGTVTNVATTSPITGGSITTTGTIACPTCTTNAASLTLNQLVFGAGGQATAVGDLTGDVTTAGGKATTIAANAVTLAKLATQATNTVLGNATSGTAVPTALAVGTCSTAGSALIWTTNTGFGCNTSITAAAAPISGLTGAGTGVLTALGVNVGSAGAFVTNGGALGSPSSAGTLPAHTLGGTISGGGNQINNVIIGATTPLAGSFTTLAATTSVYVGSGSALGGTFKFEADPGASAVSRLRLGGNGTATHLAFNFGLDTGVGTLNLEEGVGGAVRFSVTQAGLVSLPAITSDATHTDSTVCQDTTSHALYSGSGVAGICLGTSSKRFKRDIKPLNMGLKQIVGLEPVSFNYLKGYGDNGARRQVGLLAEAVNKTMPSLVGMDKDGKPQSVDYMGVMVVAVNALKELNDKFEDYRKATDAKIAAQQRTIRRLRHQR